MSVQLTLWLKSLKFQQLTRRLLCEWNNDWRLLLSVSKARSSAERQKITKLFDKFMLCEANDLLKRGTKTFITFLHHYGIEKKSIDRAKIY